MHRSADSMKASAATMWLSRFQLRATLVLVLVIAAALGCGRGQEPLPISALPGQCSAELLEAVKQKDFDRIRDLRRRGGRGDCEETRLQMFSAIRSHDVQRLRTLLAAGVDPDAPQPGSCESALGLAFGFRHAAADVQENTASPFARDARELTALLAAGANPNREWRQAGCYVTVPLGFALKPLMIAALTGDVEFASLLLKAGADPTYKDALGRTAADYAALGKRPESRQELVHLLTSAAERTSGSPSKK